MFYLTCTPCQQPFFFSSTFLFWYSFPIGNYSESFLVQSIFFPINVDVKEKNEAESSEREATRRLNNRIKA